MNTDFWSIVAQYVPPHPHTFTRLAQVNTAFYKIFMADKLWVKLDFYNKKILIAEHYLVATEQFTAPQRATLKPPSGKVKNSVYNGPRYRCKTCAIIRDPSSCDLCGEVIELKTCVQCSKEARCSSCRTPDTSNLYLTFMILVNNAVHYDTTDSNVDNKMIRSILTKEHGLLVYANARERANLEFVKRAVMLSPHALKYASDNIKNNVDVACSALRGDHTVFQYVGSTAREHPDVYTTYLRGLRKGKDRFAQK